MVTDYSVMECRDKMKFILRTISYHTKIDDR